MSSDKQYRPVKPLLHCRCRAAVGKLLGCRILSTKLSGGVSGFRERTAPKLDEVILFLREEYYRGESLCSLVLLSISRAFSSLICRLSLKADIVSFKSLSFGKL